MAKVTWKGGAMTSPLPAVLVTCRGGEKDNVFTVGWTGIVCTDPAKTYISVRPSRYSYDIIRESGEFVINLTTEALVRAVDFCGVRSGRDADKLQLCGLETENGKKVNCPILTASPLSMECRVTDVIPLGTHDMFLADIVCVDVDEKLIDKNGKLHLENAGLLAYSHGSYYGIGKKLGTFGYSVEKKSTAKKKRQRRK